MGALLEALRKRGFKKKRGMSAEEFAKAMEEKFINLVYEVAELMNMRDKVKRVVVKPLKVWGYCKPKTGELAYNPDTIKEIWLEEEGEAKFAIQVIVHEILHLRYPRHTKLFYLMERYWTDEVVKKLSQESQAKSKRKRKKVVVRA